VWLEMYAARYGTRKDTRGLVLRLMYEFYEMIIQQYYFVKVDGSARTSCDSR
jgi:hypothetical protein